ncbi:exocyst complex component EXO70B1 [Lycium barbarum]|uniref:exocyst complex component EXO70B1 n=1 Tax=Lycium barbarum TaxID=112863 RepID=UPI00293F0D1D|nr:exocyst complex component EXO70B1 [Lycium barbarum]
MAATIEGQDRVLAAAQQIVKSLNTSTNVDTDDMLMILSTFDNRLSKLSNLMTSSSSSTPTSAKSAAAAAAAAGADESFTDPRFEAAEQLILHWNSPQSADPDSTFEYLAAVDEIIQMTEDLNVENDPLMDRAEAALQHAMAHLEDEFRHILIGNTVPFDAGRLHESSFIRRCSISSSAAEIPDFETGTLSEDQEDVSSGRYNHVKGKSLGGVDEFSLDLVYPDAMIDLREIANRMIRSGYEKECCQVYSSVRREVLDECLAILGIEKLSIEEVHRIEWQSLDEKMKKWIYAVKVLVRILLSAEKSLCEQIFVESELIKEVCFMETAKGCVMQLLNFGEAVAIGRRSSEKLFRILDMYDALADVLSDIDLLFSDEAGEMVCSEAKGVLDGLGEAAIGTFVEFENAVQREASKKPTQGGEIHPLTRYVMNYVKLLVDYSDTLNGLLEKLERGMEPDSSRNDNGDNSELENVAPLARRLMLLIKSLEGNLEGKSRMYEDCGMQYIFLMNNVHYIVQKVKDSELQKLLGDQWVRKRRGQIRQHATSYLRASWSKVLSCLKDEGLSGSSSNASKVALKERFKSFNACFEEIYRIQTGWKVPDAQLREELRISISEKVLPAYRSFLGRFGGHLESGRNAGKYIKYTLEDLEGYLLDLFEGSPLVLHHLRRKGT